jgi:sec-independent protein translocase protein TatB
MFDVGFWEVTLIALISLLVVGPERLPKLARTLGAYVGKARRMVADVKAEVDRELKADEFRNSAGGEAFNQLKDAAQEARSVGRQLKSELDETIAVDAPNATSSAESPDAAKEGGTAVDEARRSPARSDADG